MTQDFSRSVAIDGKSSSREHPVPGEPKNHDAGSRYGLADPRYRAPRWPREGGSIKRPCEPSIAPKIHIIDQDTAFSAAVTSLLTSVGLASIHYTTADKFLAVANLNAPGCLLLEVGFPSLSALNFQARLSREAAIMPVVLMADQVRLPHPCAA
jgi:hypothetical protein